MSIFDIKYIYMLFDTFILRLKMKNLKINKLFFVRKTLSENFVMLWINISVHRLKHLLKQI